MRTPSLLLILAAFLVAPLAGPPASAQPLEPQARSSQTDTRGDRLNEQRNRAARDRGADELAQRLEELEERLGRYERALAAHLAECPSPPPDRRPRPRPEPIPGPRPRPDVAGWPSVPEVAVALDPRGPPALELVSIPAGEWQLEPTGWRWSRSDAELAGLAVLVWREQWPGWDATRTTVVLVNGWPDADAIYLESMRVAVEGAAAWSRDDHDVVDPRRALPLRFWSGPDADAVRTWQHIEPAGPSLPWLEQLAAQSRVHTLASAAQLGPYRLADPDIRGSGSLEGSEGGRSISRYWGGPDGWQVTGREGLRWMAEEWPLQLARSPLVLLEPGTFTWWNPVRAAREARELALANGDPHPPAAPGYWPGSTVGNEPPGYSIVDVPSDGGSWTWPLLDGWCAYQHALRTLRPHDHTHLRRASASALAVAEHDVPARWFSAQVAGNLACWLDGAPAGLSLLQWFPQMLASSPPHQGDGRGGRGWGQVLACLVESEPWYPVELATPSWGGTWLDAARALTVRWAMPSNGWTHRTGKGAFPSPAPDWGPLINVETITAPRELFLVAANYEALGLEGLLAAARLSLAPIVQPDGSYLSTGEHVESGPGVHHWSKTYRNPNAQPTYEAMIGLYDRWGGVEGLLEAARVDAGTSSASGRETLLDNLPRQAWQAVLP